MTVVVAILLSVSYGFLFFRQSLVAPLYPCRAWRPRTSTCRSARSRIARSPGRQRAFRFVRRRNLVVVHEVLTLLENVLDGTAFLCADLPNNSNVGSRRSIWPSFSSRWCSKACHNRPSRRHRPSWATICKFAFLPTILEGIQETVL